MPPRQNPDHPRRERSRRRGPLVAAGAAVAVAGVLAVVVFEQTDRSGGLPAAGAEPTTSASAAAPDYPSDQLGYLDSSARCDDDQELVVYGRTSRSMVVICVDPTGELEYRGVRLSDEASLQMPAGRAADGSIVATNDGVTYAISPDALLVSEGDTVLYRDDWAEFVEPRFPTATAAAPTTGSPTVSTTTVTMTSPPGQG